MGIIWWLNMKKHRGKLMTSKEVKIDPQVYAHRCKLTEMMTEIESMQDCHLDCLIVTKHCIELASDKIRPLQCAP